MLKPVQIKKDIWWVGGLDWNARSFHGYTTEDGITYNAYLIVDEHITLIDTTKATFSHELLQRISQIVDPSQIEYIISNHVEMDHSGSLPAIMAAAPNATIVTSDPQGIRGLTAHYGDAYKYMGVKTGDELCIGKRTLTFVQTPMVHWPDNMVTYDSYDCILFSNDAFGQHFASSGRFDDENDFSEVMLQATKYFANIVHPYLRQVKAAIEAVESIGRENIELIAPSHGVIWRSHVAEILDYYAVMAANTLTEKAVVVYDTMWGSTEKIARAIVDAFSAEGVEAHLMSLQANHPSDIATTMIDARYICVGSPTLNSQMLATVSGALTYFKGLYPSEPDRIGLAFGSYGWAPVGPRNVSLALKDMGIQQPVSPITVNWIPDDEVLNGIRNNVRMMISEGHRSKDCQYRA